MLKHIFAYYNDLKIAKKLTFLTLSTAFITGLVMIALLVAYKFYSEKKATVTEAKIFAQILADNIAPSIIDKDVLAISNTLSSVEYNYKIRQTFAFNRDWKMLGAFHQGSDFYKKRQIVSVIRENENLWRKGFYYSVVPIFYEDQHLGSLVVVASLHDFYLNVLRDSTVVIFVIIFALLLTFKLRKTLQNAILVPISTLDRMTSTVVTTKALDQTIPVYNNDELGDLAKNFNFMLSELNSYQTELNAQKDILEYQANHDVLTKLPNRALFNDRLHQTVYKSARQNEQFALLFLDLDHFKEVNDTYGHDFGDMLLQEVTQKLKKLIREEDTLARLGGDEFTIILQSLKDPIMASTIAAKFLAMMQEPILVCEQYLQVGCSIGISLYPQDSIEPSELIKFADIAMYRAKEIGRNTYQFYKEEMTQRIINRTTMQSKIRQALEKKEFTVFYQPQYNAIDDRIVGLEALVRWPDKDGTILPPIKFLPLSEELGLIADISNQVMGKVMRQVAAWHENKIEIKKVSVNITISQLEDTHFVALIKEMLAQSGCRPEWIVMEITEGQMMRNPERAITALQELNHLGFSISVDDFGTGHSSLAYLKRFPVHELKIDQSFVRDLETNPDDVLIVEAIIALAKSLKIDIIAEGVETEGQKTFLISRGCHFIQGFYYAYPMDAESMTQMLILDGLVS